MSPNFVSDRSDSPEERYKPKLLLTGGIFELLEKSPRGDVLSHGATPLDRINNLEQQSEAFRRLRTLANYRPDSVPRQIGRYVSETFRARFIGRGEANDENFTTRIVQDYENTVDPRFIEMIERGKTGHASPAELMLIRDLLGIGSIELACLTHPYGETKDTFKDMNTLLAEMRESVRYGVQLFGGESYDPPEDVRLKVKEIVGENDTSLLIDGKSPGLLMTRKRKLATLPDGTIIRERYSFILRIDPDSKLYKMIGPEKIEELKTIQQLSGPEQKDALEEFEAKITVLLDMDEFEEAIPVSTTVYAFNKETKLEVIRLQAEHERQNQTYLEEQNPEITETPPVDEAAIAAHRAILERAIKNVQSDMRILAMGKRTLDSIPGRKPRKRK